MKIRLTGRTNCIFCFTEGDAISYFSGGNLVPASLSFGVLHGQAATGAPNTQGTVILR